MKPFLPAVLLAFAVALPVAAQEVDCDKCHAKLGKEKVVHAALGMGCASCHSAVDASKTPHRITNKIAKGLSAEQPDLCYGCHDKAQFEKKNVHAAVGMGCTGCHNPHSSKNEKLLQTPVPDICMNCHDKSEFEKKYAHAALGMGCMTCHQPHASDEMALLMKKPVAVCLECHPDVPKKPHAVAGFSSSGHPLGVEKKAIKDPARPGKPFYCGSCHVPHSSDGPRLLRFNAKSAMALCTNCHKM